MRPWVRIPPLPLGELSCTKPNKALRSGIIASRQDVVNAIVCLVEENPFRPQGEKGFFIGEYNVYLFADGEVEPRAIVELDEWGLEHK